MSLGVFSRKTLYYHEKQYSISGRASGSRHRVCIAIMLCDYRLLNLSEPVY